MKSPVHFCSILSFLKPGRLWWAVLISVLAAFTLMAVAAAEEPSTITATQSLSVPVSGGKLIRLPSPAASVFVADPAIADVQTPSSSAMFVFGKKPGRTALYALTATGAPIAAYNVVVGYNDPDLRERFRAEAGDLPLKLSPAANGAILSGEAPTPEAAQRLHDVASRYAGQDGLSDQLRVKSSMQVNLRVRVAEVARSVSQTLGFNWNAAFSSGSFAIGLQTGGLAAAGASVASGIDNIFGRLASKQVNGTVVFDAMAREGLMTILAEPNLTAVSGQTAKFLAGGEYPIPVPQALGVTSIEYKRYGVSVSFTPIVYSSGLISMRVQPEVSQIDQANAVQLNGVTVPGLTTRQADTTVELASGQSFAIAGLLQNNVANSVQKIPWLADIPVLGALFRSNQFQRNETELVIIVTPFVVRPAEPSHAPLVPTDYIGPPSDLERLLYSKVAERKGVPFDPERMPRLRGAAGFLFE